MSPILPCICQNRKKNCQLTSTHRVTTARTECQKCYGIHSVGSQLQDGLTGYLQEHRQNASDKAALWGRAEVALLLRVEGWTNGPASRTHVRPCYRGKRFPITTSAFRAQGDCQCGHCCAGIPTQPIICRSTPSRRAKYFSYQTNTEQLLYIPNRQWFIYLQAWKQSQFQHVSQIQQHPWLQHRHDYPALAVCSTLKALSAMRTLMQAWTQMKRSGQFHPIPFFPFWQLLIRKIHILQALTYIFWRYLMIDI